MGLGTTAKKLQRVADMAEDVYKRMNELREQVVEMRETVEETERRTDRLEAEFAEQRALLEAIADDAGLDVDEVAARAHIGEAEARAAEEERPDVAETGGDGDGSGTTDESADDGGPTGDGTESTEGATTGSTGE